MTAHDKQATTFQRWRDAYQMDEDVAPSLIDLGFAVAAVSAARRAGLSAGELSETAEGEPADRFMCLWTAAALHWREKDYDDFNDVVGKLRSCADQIRDQPADEFALAYLRTLEAQSLMITQEDGTTRAEEAAEGAVTMSESLRAQRRSYGGPLPGAQNVYAEVVASTYEAADFDLGTHQDPDADRAEAIRKALNRIGAAIVDRPDYAKYHATKARLLLLLPGRESDAYKSIRKAMSLEEAGQDFGVRMVEYTAIRERIGLERRLRQARDRLESLTRRTEDSELRTVQVATLLAGIVALVVVGGAAGTARGLSPETAAAVVLTLALPLGWLIILFAALVPGKANVRKLSIAAASYAAGLLLAGLAAHVVLA